MRNLLLTLLFLGIALLHAQPVSSHKRIRVQLNWTSQFEFAGFYMARELGLYEREGLEVEILKGGENMQPSVPERLERGEADFGVAYAGILVKDPGRFVVMGALYAHTPLVLLVKNPKTRTLDALKGIDIFLNPNEREMTALSLLLERVPEHGPLHPHDWEKFKKSQKSAAIDLFAGNRKFYEIRDRIQDYFIIDPGTYGYDFYHDFLVTTRDFWESDPVAARKFAMATIEGWRYALNHIDETVRILHEKYFKELDEELLRYEAERALHYVGDTGNRLGMLEKKKVASMIERFRELHEKSPPVEPIDVVDPLFFEHRDLIDNAQRWWMARHIVRYSETDWPPFSIREGNRLTGIVPDFMELVYRRTGLLMRYAPRATWPEVLSDVRDRRIDMAIATARTPERERYGRFSIPYDIFPFGLATLADRDDIDPYMDRDVTLAAGRSYTAETYLLHKFPNLKIESAPTTAVALRWLMEGKVDGVVDILPTLKYDIERLHMTGVKILTPFKRDFPLRALFRKDWPEAVRIYNIGLSQITDTERSIVYNRWLPVEVENDRYRWLLVPLAVSLALLILLTGALVWMRREVLRRRKAEEELTRLLEIVDRYVLMYKTDRNGVITYVSQAYCDLTGFSKKELIGRDHSMLRHPETPDIFYKKMWETLESGKVWEFEELRNICKDGTEFWVHAQMVPMFDEKGEMTGYMSFRRDITPYKKMEEIAHRDMLTGFYNRRAFNLMFEERIGELKRKGGTFAFGIYDVDHFKPYNDLYGHQAGDDVLARISEAVRENCRRSNDLLFRLGGEEFGVLVDAESLEEAELCARELVESVRALKIEHRGNEPHGIVTISLGMIFCRVQQGAHLRMEALYSYCDRLMYRVKEEGRNGWRVEDITTLEICTSGVSK